MVVSESNKKQRPSSTPVVRSIGAGGWLRLPVLDLYTHRDVYSVVIAQYMLDPGRASTLWGAQGLVRLRSGRIAQLVERWSNKPLVLGSSPNVTTLFYFWIGR
jgi:hypothetical protein